MDTRVVGRDPAWAEVCSKALFVAGAISGPRWTRHRGLAAVFVRDDGRWVVTPAGLPYVERP